MAEKAPVSNKKLSADWFLHGALTRIGDTLDRFTGRRWTPSSSLATSGLVERLKRLLDAEVRDIPGKGPVVPHHLRLLVQWDKFSTDGAEGLKKLENELLTAAADHINDNLYYTMAPLMLEVKQDYFVEGVRLSASFDSFAADQPEANLSVTMPGIDVKGILLSEPEEAPAPETIGFIARFSIAGRSRERRFNLGVRDRVSIGRVGSNRFSLEDASVSKAHASMMVDEEANLSVADTGSTNGTFVNGQRIAYGKAVKVGPEDIVRFGNVEVVFERAEVENLEEESEPPSDGMTIDGFTFNTRTEPSGDPPAVAADPIPDTVQISAKAEEPAGEDR